MIGHDDVNFYKVGGFRRSNEKSGLNWWAPGVGQPSIERDVKDILEAELDCLLLRRIRKPVKWFERLRLLVCQEGQNLIYDRFVNHSVRLPDQQVDIVVKPDVWRSFQLRLELQGRAELKEVALRAVVIFQRMSFVFIGLRRLFSFG